MNITLPSHSEETLVDLFHAVKGKVGKFIDATAAKHQCLFCLERKEIITIETTTDEYGKRQRRAALTKAGKIFAESSVINAPDRLPKNPALMPKADERQRISIYFQLELDKPAHVETLRRVKALKRAGRYNPTIRRLLELEEQLGQSGIDDVFEAIAALRRERDLLESNKAYISEMKAALDQREKELDEAWEELEAERRHDTTLLDVKDELKELRGLLKNGAVAQPEQKVGPRPVPKVEARKPDNEDDETDENGEPLLVVKKDLLAGKRATENFLRSILSLQDDSEEETPEEEETQEVEAAAPAGPKQLNVTQFQLPVFDDDEDDDLDFLAAVGD